MALTIDLSPQEEARLATVAQQNGLEPAELAKKLVTDHLPTFSLAEEQDPTLALFAQWEKEDANMASEEIAAENRTWEEFKTNINAERDRTGARRVF